MYNKFRRCVASCRESILPEKPSLLREKRGKTKSIQDKKKISDCGGVPI